MFKTRVFTVECSVTERTVVWRVVEVLEDVVAHLPRVSQTIRADLTDTRAAGLHHPLTPAFCERLLNKEGKM